MKILLVLPLADSKGGFRGGGGGGGLWGCNPPKTFEL